MRNYIQPGHTITVPSPIAVKSGEGVVIGVIFGIACSDAEIADDLDLRLEGVFELPRVDGETVGIGDTIYFNESERLATTVAEANPKIGIASSVATSTIRVRLVPAC